MSSPLCHVPGFKWSYRRCEIAECAGRELEYSECTKDNLFGKAKENVSTALYMQHSTGNQPKSSNDSVTTTPHEDMSRRSKRIIFSCLKGTGRFLWCFRIVTSLKQR